MELEVYAALAYCIKALRNRKYDAARDALVLARDFLDKGIKGIEKKTLALEKTEVEALATSIEKIAKEIIIAASQDPGYAGSLTKIEGLLKDGSTSSEN